MGLPNWKTMRRRTIRFTREGLECIRMLIREFKTEIPDHQQRARSLRSTGICQRMGAAEGTP
jgi:hypothetical protein